MPDPKLQAYLAQHYLSGPKADAILARQESEQGTDKKRKKKRKTSHRDQGEGGLRLRDDGDDWKKDTDDDQDNESAHAQASSSSSKEKFRKGAFKGVGWDSTQPGSAPHDDNIPERGEDAPQVAGVSDAMQAADSGPSRAEQPRSGLKTKEQVRAERLEREEAERREQEDEARLRRERGQDEDEEAMLAQQTVHRDSRGRKIGVEAEEKAQRREEERQRRKEAEKKQQNRGEAQRTEERKRREELERVKDEGVARYATDKRMNDELRARERADDPALAFLTKKRSTAPSMPKYKGPPPPPNRFGIAPGYRWDGVVRGNGFEKKLFEARGEKQRREQDAHAYGASDM
ncbi:unnamed protein product [Sympodiomycopsis kandeliae]